MSFYNITGGGVSGVSLSLSSGSNRGLSTRESLLKLRGRTSGKWRGDRWNINRRRLGGSAWEVLNVFVHTYIFICTYCMYVHTYCVGCAHSSCTYVQCLPFSVASMYACSTYVRTYVYSECECVGVQMCVGVFLDVDSRGSISDLEETKPFEAAT